MVRRRPVELAATWRPDESVPVRRHPLCAACERWLASVITDVRAEERATAPLFGAPSPGGRTLVFEDQCQLCLAMPRGRGTVIDCVAVGPGHRSWAPLFLCTSCDAWLASLAEDGRSARGGARRAIDGAYGDWPHPNLRSLRVALDLADRPAAATIAQTCAAMGVTVARGADLLGSVLFVELTPGASVAARVSQGRQLVRATILLAPLEAHRELREALAAGAMDWMTLPITPQQVTAALSGSLRRRPPAHWDEDSCLRRASLSGSGRPALLFEPLPGTDLFTLAWLLRRFARGYDDVVSVEGRVVLLPRVAPEHLDEVRSRLELLLAGRCRAFPLEAPAGEHRRIDVAG